MRSNSSKPVNLNAAGAAEVSRLGVGKFNYLTSWEHKRARPAFALMFDKLRRGETRVAKGEAS